MQITNGSQIMTFSDLPSPLGGDEMGLTLQPSAVVALWDGDAARSAQLQAAVTASLVTITGTQQPASGSVVKQSALVIGASAAQITISGAASAGLALVATSASAAHWAAAPSATDAVNLAGGAAGEIPYQSAAATTLFSAAGSSGQSLLSGGTGAPTWGTPAAATASTNLLGGAAGEIPYQSAAATTLFSAAGTAGQVLLSGGTSAPTWGEPASSSAPGTASSTGIAGQIAYDATHIYVCIATNTWVRATLASF